MGAGHLSHAWGALLLAHCCLHHVVCPGVGVLVHWDGCAVLHASELEAQVIVNAAYGAALGGVQQFVTAAETEEHCSPRAPRLQTWRIRHKYDHGYDVDLQQACGMSTL